tara:strand:- start:328 stop:1023 length:696 start_codon:yes stop_codon:yes gene_type:complete
MPRSTMPELSMEIEHPEEEDTAGYLKQSDYLKKPKPQKPSSLKKPVENTVVSEEAVEKPVKKKRVMSEKQKAALAKAREVSAKKRKEKKALEGTTKAVKAKKPMERMPTIDEESESDSSDDDDETPLIQHEMPHVIQQRSTPKKKQSVEERVYQRIMSEKLERKAARAQKKEEDRLAREYEQSIREDERRVLYEMTQKAPPKPKKQVNAAAMLQPNIWEQAFAPKRSPFGF